MNSDVRAFKIIALSLMIFKSLILAARFTSIADIKYFQGIKFNAKIKSVIWKNN
jgi:hypothetical protein